MFTFPSSTLAAQNSETIKLQSASGLDTTNSAAAGVVSNPTVTTTAESEAEAEMESLNKEVLRINNVRSNLMRRMKMYTPDDVTLDTVDEVGIELEKIHDLMDEYCNSVEILVDQRKEDLGAENVKKYEDDIPYIMNQVKQHESQILNKKKEVSPPPTPLSTYESQMLSLQLKSLKIQESTVTKADTEKLVEATVLAETKSNEFFGETSVMGDLLLEENWDLADNSVVSQGMRLLKDWQVQMNVIERKYRDFENDALKHNFPADKTEAIDSEYTRIRAKFETVKDAVIHQDKERGLFTLEPAKTEKMKWPIFYGNQSEDFTKWQEKMDLAFLKNRVPKDERVDKLREHLRNKALALVPESTKDIESAYKILKDAFGDPVRVLDHKLKALDEFGPYPNDKVGKGLPGYGKQVDWLLKVEGVIRDIIELGEKYEELDRDAFSTATLRKIVERFPEKMVARFNRLKGDGKIRLKAFHKQLEEKRV